MSTKLYATPDGRAVSHGGHTIQTLRFQDAIDGARPGDEIRVLPGVYEEPVVVRGKEGTEAAPLRIVGTSATTLDGRRNPVRPPGLATVRDFAFIKVLKSAHVTIENMTIQNVWPTAIYVEDAQHVLVRRINLNGATYGIFARGPTTSHLTIEYCSWIQDERIWDQIAWKDIHLEPLPRRELDGDLFRSVDIAGNVVIRRNFIAQAFNGVHFYADEVKEPGKVNTNVWIYRNTFAFIRDNAIEAENSATNWWVFENRIYNCHAWFAFEECNGGFWYIFANRGWFDRKPGPPGDCNAGGALLKTSTVKIGDEERKLTKDPVYVFNNSWYLRSTYMKKGKLRNFNHFNNAIEYARPEYHPAGVVDPDQRMIGVGPPSPRCDGPQPPEEPFTTEWARLAIAFDNDVCNHQHYPGRLNLEGYAVRGLAAEPGFLSARDGEFGLREDSPCRQRGVARTVQIASGLQWTIEAGVNVGAMRDAENVYTPDALGCPRVALPDGYQDLKEEGDDNARRLRDEAKSAFEGSCPSADALTRSPAPAARRRSRRT
jgi:hypothetical protein